MRSVVAPMKWGGASQKWVEKRCVPYVNEIPGNIFSQGANWQTQMPSLVVDVLFCHACDFLRWLLLSKELFRDEPLWAKSQPCWLWNVWYGDSIAVSREGNYTPFFFLFMLPAASTSLFEASFLSLWSAFGCFMFGTFALYVTRMSCLSCC